MDAFDAAGHQRQPQERTPVLHRGPHDGVVTGRVRTAKAAPPLPSLPAAHPPAAAPAPATSTEQELRDKVEHLEVWSREASTLLSSYQFAIAELEDRHSSTLVSAQAEARVLRVEVRGRDCVSDLSVDSLLLVIQKGPACERPTLLRSMVPPTDVCTNHIHCCPRRRRSWRRGWKRRQPRSRRSRQPPSGRSTSCNERSWISGQPCIRPTRWAGKRDEC